MICILLGIKDLGKERNLCLLYKKIKFKKKKFMYC